MGKWMDMEGLYLKMEFHLMDILKMELELIIKNVRFNKITYIKK